MCLFFESSVKRKMLDQVVLGFKKIQNTVTQCESIYKESQKTDSVWSWSATLAAHFKETQAANKFAIFVCLTAQRIKLLESTLKKKICSYRKESVDF